MDIRIVLTGLGNRIRDIRQENNLTQYELALRCDFEKATMSRIESGKTNPTIHTLFKICNALDIHMVELFKTGRKIKYLHLHHLKSP